MPTQIYHRFEQFNFSNHNCFLSGETLSSEEEKIQVFPAWLMSSFNLADQPFKLLDESYATYKDLKLPCAAAINDQYLEPLEAEIAAAFEEGFDAVNSVD